MALELFQGLLIAQILMGAFDTLVHHELTERLALKPSQRHELRLHALRALIYGLLFLVFGWLDLAGPWLWGLSALIATEFGLTLADFVEEDRTRLLPASERVLHTLLAVNGGAMTLAWVLSEASDFGAAAAISPVDHGWVSWFLTAAALGIFVSAIRDWRGSRQRLPIAPALLAGKPLRVLVTGATGFIGDALCRRLLAGGHELTVISRQPRRAVWQFGGALRAYAEPEQLPAGSVFDLVVNLSGAPVVGLPWTSRRKRVLLDSRIQLTKRLVAALAATASTRSDAEQAPGPVFVQASAMGFYGQHATGSDEAAVPGQDFAGQLCADWEQAAAPIRQAGYRLVVLRLGLVLGPRGGILWPLAESAGLGMASVLGSGRQMFPWVHLDDVMAVIERAVREAAMAGPYNLCAPGQVDQAEFSRTLAAVLRRPCWLRVPAWALRLLLGEMADMLLASPPASAARLIASGYQFRFPDLRAALSNALAKT